MDRDQLEDVGALSALGDPTRRRAYDHVAAEGRPVGREEVAAALGIGRTLAAYHLDRLAADGLLSVSYERRSGRSGPGAGRPAKMYDRSEREVVVSVPPRDYGLAARLLAARGGARRARRDAPRPARRRDVARPRDRRRGAAAGRPRAAAARARLRAVRGRRRRDAPAQLPLPRRRPDPSRGRLRHEPQPARRAPRRPRRRRRRGDARARPRAAAASRSGAAVHSGEPRRGVRRVRRRRVQGWRSAARRSTVGSGSPRGDEPSPRGRSPTRGRPSCGGCLLRWSWC